MVFVSTANKKFSFFGIPFPSRLIFAANSTASMTFLYPVQRQI